MNNFYTWVLITTQDNRQVYKLMRIIEAIEYNKKQAELCKP